MQTLDEPQAVRRADEHVSQAMAALGSAPALELQSQLRTACEDPTDFGPEGRVQLSRRYRLAGAPAGVFELLHAHWRRHGYRVLDDGRHRTVEDMATGEVRPAPLLWVEHDADGFRLTLVADVRGHLSLIVTSPCIWPDGVPPPKSRVSC